MKKGRMFFLPICGLALTLVLTSFVSSPARADATRFILPQVYHIVNRNSGKLLEVYNNVRQNGALVDQWETSGCQCQQWRFIIANPSSGPKWIYYIKNIGTGKNLDVNQFSAAQGVQLQVWNFNGGTNQQWTINKTASRGYATIKNVGNQLVLGVSSERTDDGAPVVQWGDTGVFDQQWTLVCVEYCLYPF